jgi:enamine deaminase RidA (YjgF/YER057c/UK114 family)
MMPAFSHQIGRYADAIRVTAGCDLIVVSGTPDLDENGNIPVDFADEARQAYRNVAAILKKAGASIRDIVSIRRDLTRKKTSKTYVAVRTEMIVHQPAAMLLAPGQWRWPEIHVEVEAVALVPLGRGAVRTHSPKLTGCSANGRSVGARSWQRFA